MGARASAGVCAAAVAAWLLGGVPAARADTSVEHGKTIFQHTCGNCHSPEIGVNKVGPSLWHIVGRKIAVVPGYDYSETLRTRQTEWQVWDAAALDVYLRNPREAVHGVRMYFKGLPDENERADVIAYLRTLR
jgi:cytochrome c